MKVGIVGTGAMGRLLVDRLLGAGHEVTAYARRAEVRQDLRGAGVRCVDHPHDLAIGADVVIVYVLTDEQVTAVAIDDGVADAMEPGSTLLLATTCSPTTARAVAAHVASRGAATLDAPASGGPERLADGTLTVFAGGDGAVLDRCRPVLDAYATTVAHVGPVGAGQLVKLLNNLLFGAHVELAVEAARLGAGFGLDPAALAQTLHTCSGSSYALDLIGVMGSAEALLQRGGAFIHKDVQLARDTAATIGAELGSIGAIVGPLLARTAAYAPPARG